MTDEDRKSFSQRAKNAFPEGKTDFGDQYIQAFLGSWKDLTDTIRRTTLLILLAVAILELFNRGAIEEFSLGPIKLSDLDIVYKVLPVVIAYLFYEQIASSLRWADMHDLYFNVMAHLHGDVSENNLDAPLTPQLPSLWNLSVGETTGSTTSFIMNFRDWLSAVLAFIVIVLVVAFEGYSLYQLVRRFHWSDLFTTGSVIFTCLIVVLSLFTLVMWIREL